MKTPSSTGSINSQYSRSNHILNIRNGEEAQLSYIERDLKIIEKQIEHTSLTVLSKGQYRKLLVISELYQQQGPPIHGHESGATTTGSFFTNFQMVLL
jgi:hypothetical protein